MGPAQDANLFPPRSRFAPGAVLLQQKPNPASEPVGAPAPGANGGLPGALIGACFVRGSHRGGAPTAKNQNVPPEPVGAPAPGANGACPRRQSVPAASAARTEAVLLQQN